MLFSQDQPGPAVDELTYRVKVTSVTGGLGKPHSPSLQLRPEGELRGLDER